MEPAQIVVIAKANVEYEKKVSALRYNCTVVFIQSDMRQYSKFYDAR